MAADFAPTVRYSQRPPNWLTKWENCYFELISVIRPPMAVELKSPILRKIGAFSFLISLFVKRGANNTQKKCALSVVADFATTKA